MAWFEQSVQFNREVLKLAHVTDSHLFAKRNGEYFGVNTADHFLACLTHMATKNLDAVVFGGDLTQDHSVESYSLFAQLIAESPLTCPVFWLPGNHDELNLLTSLANKQISNAKRLITNSFTVLLLNSKGTTPAGWVTDAHLTEVVGCLEQTKLPSVVFCHHNPLPINGYLDKHMLENGPQLLNRLNNSNYVNWLFHGHVHNSYEFDYRDMKVVSTPASSVQFLKNTPDWQQQNQGAAYRLITLSKNADSKNLTCDTELVWLNV